MLCAVVSWKPTYSVVAPLVVHGFQDAGTPATPVLSTRGPKALELAKEEVQKVIQVSLRREYDVVSNNVNQVCK